MPYQLDYEDDARGGAAAGNNPAHDDTARRNRSLSTLVAGFAALAPPPPAQGRPQDLPELTGPPVEPSTRSSGRIRSALASLSATSASSAAAVDSLQIHESYDGVRVLWDVTFAGGGGTVVIITPPRRRDPDGDAVPLPGHVSWRGADAIPGCDVLAFASVLMQAAQKADSLPVVVLPADRSGRGRS